MIGSITPLVQVAAGKRRWGATLIAYAVGSIAASALLGSCLGLVGKATGGPSRAGHAVLLASAGALALMELGLVPRPQARILRQTQKRWRIRYGPIGSALLWGGDLGLGITTRVSFASFWAVVIACVAVAQPVHGAVLMGGYGLGRAALVASGPLVVERRHPTTLMSWLFQNQAAWHRLHGICLLAMAAVVLSR